MNAVNNPYASPTRCETDPPQCSTCGSLECLCRPRFFAGQILTADDLNRLESYIVGKNRLHNRQLFGWGVVNGLEVTCDACGKGVVVGCGYALSPCGDDIVVCDATAVDICTLIRNCCVAERKRPCDPAGQPLPAGCDDDEAEWILCIRYNETPSRPVKPMMPPSNGCSCGGSSKASCGCGGGSTGKCGCGNGGAKTKPRGAPAQCEPTILCEGYTFCVYRKPVKQDPPEGRKLAYNPDSELLTRLLCCLKSLQEGPKAPGDPTLDNIKANQPPFLQWAAAARSYLRNLFSKRPFYDCDLLARLNTIVLPSGNNADPQQLKDAIDLISLIVLEAILDCFCSALLPPCPQPVFDDCVPIASVRVSGSDCRVLSICNWTTERRFVLTFPTLRYWLSPLPFGPALRELIDKICCREIRLPGNNERVGGLNAAGLPNDAPMNAPMNGPYQDAFDRLNPVPDHVERLQGSARMAAQAARRGIAPLDPRQLIASVFLSEKDRPEDALSSADFANLPQYLFLNQLIRPIALQSAVGALLGNVGGIFGGANQREAPPAPHAQPDPNVKGELDELRAELARQAKLIDELRKRKK